MQGFLACIDIWSGYLFNVSLSLFGLSLAYPLAPNAYMRFGDTWMQVITAGSLITSVSSWILSGLSSYLKDSESTDDVWFTLFRWLLLKVLLFLNIVRSEEKLHYH